MDRGGWKAAVHGVAEGRTWLSDFTFTFHFHALEKEMATHSSLLPGESQAALKCLPTLQETWVQTLDLDDLLEKEMATQSSIPTWEIPWTEEPGELWFMGSQRVRHD